MVPKSSELIPVSVQNTFAGRVAATEIRALVTDILGVEVPGEGSFIGHGGDSFHAVVIVSRIEEQWGVEVEFLDVLNSTPDGLTETVNTALSGPAQQ